MRRHQGSVTRTQRLQLDWVRHEDAPFLLQLMTQPSWLRNIGDRGLKSVEDATAHIASRIDSAYQTHGYGLWVVRTKRPREPVGLCGLVRRHELDGPDLGFALLETQWGRGYAREAATAVARYAFDELLLSQLWAITTPTNLASQRLLLGLGFALDSDNAQSPQGERLHRYLLTPQRFVADVSAG